MIIGVTGGVGTGKSTILQILKEDHHAEIIMADDVAKDLMMPGETAYQSVVSFFGTRVLSDGAGSEIDRKKLSDIVFKSPEKLKILNEMTHPAVKERIKEMIRKMQAEGAGLIVIEAALLIQAGYLDLLDCLWVVHTDYEKRVQRLSESRGYSREKTDSIIKSQMPEQEMEQMADVVIDNSFDQEYTKQQIKEALHYA